MGAGSVRTPLLQGSRQGVWHGRKSSRGHLTVSDLHPQHPHAVSAAGRALAVAFSAGGTCVSPRRCVYGAVLSQSAGVTRSMQRRRWPLSLTAGLCME